MRTQSVKAHQRPLLLLVLPFFLLGCSKPLSNEELLHNAYLDVIEAKEEKIRPLVALTLDEEKLTWNEAGDRVLLFTLHRFPSSYPEGQDIVFTWGESWLCSLKEYQRWYLTNKSNIVDPLLRTKQVLGMAESSKNTYISAMWMKPSDLKRPAYISDPIKPMELSFAEGETEEYKAWFSQQYYYSYDVAHLPWTRLGYTYDWSREAKDRYGLSEFIAFKGTAATVVRTILVTDYLASL